jgi:putative DNA primase/helicase
MNALELINGKPAWEHHGYGSQEHYELYSGKPDTYDFYHRRPWRPGPRIEPAPPIFRPKPAPPREGLGQGEGRHQQLLTYAGQNWRGQDEEEFAQLLMRFDERMHNPSHGEAHCRSIARWYVERGKEPVVSGAKVVLGTPVQEWKLENFTAVESRPIRWLWKDYLALGKMTTVNGEPGSGKSLTLLDTAARLTTGQPWADGAANTVKPCDVLLLTLEEDAGDTIKPRFLAARGDPRRLYRLAVNGRAAFFKIEDDRERLARVFREHEIKLVILDPMLDFVSAEANKDSDVRDVLTRLVDLAQEFEFSVAGINHLNKKSDLAAMHRVAGARGWTSVARINYLVGRGENEVDGAALRHLCPLKLNLSADDRGSLDFSVKTRPVTDGLISGAEFAYVNWLGRGSASADDITIAKPVKTSAVDEWLRSFLSVSWTPVKDVHEAGRAEGYSQDQIKRGLFRINAEHRRTQEVPAKTEWRLVSAAVQPGQ